MKFFTIILGLAVMGGDARADVITTDPAQEVEKAKPAEASPDTSPSSPPLETDDPGTPGPYGIEVNFPFGYDSFSGGSLRSGGIDANLGLGERWQLRVEQNYIEDHEAEQPALKGVDGTSIGLKYRFFDDGALKLAFYPSYQLNDASSFDSEGRSFYFPLILAEQLGRFTLIENIGYRCNFDFHDRHEFFTSVAAGYGLADTTRLMAEIASTKLKGARDTNLRAGLVQEIFPSEKSRLETALFASVGRSVGETDDGITHTTFLIGFTLARKADGEK